MTSPTREGLAVPRLSQQVDDEELHPDEGVAGQVVPDLAGEGDAAGELGAQLGKRHAARREPVVEGVEHRVAGEDELARVEARLVRLGVRALRGAEGLEPGRDVVRDEVQGPRLVPERDVLEPLGQPPRELARGVGVGGGPQDAEDEPDLGERVARLRRVAVLDRQTDLQEDVEDPQLGLPRHVGGGGEVVEDLHRRELAPVRHVGVVVDALEPLRLEVREEPAHLLPDAGAEPLIGQLEAEELQGLPRALDRLRVLRGHRLAQRQEVVDVHLVVDVLRPGAGTPR